MTYNASGERGSPALGQGADVLRILIVAWAWPPIGRVGAMRPLGFAREWTRAGHEVHVLTGPGDRGGEYTPDLVPRAEASGASVHRANAPGIRAPDRLRAFGEGVPTAPHPEVSRLRQIAAQWKRFPDEQRSWIAPASARAAELHRQHSFDVVWTTSPPESVHYVGRSLAGLGVPWVADFRDQWSDYLLARWDPLSRFVIDRIAHRVLKSASAITGATEGVVRSIARAASCRVVCVRNGFDGARDPVTRENVRPRSLGYFGRVDPHFQHPERLWPALRAARESGAPWTLDIYAAPGGGGGADIAVPSDLMTEVRVHAPLPHPLALAEMQRMAALLVLAWETRGGETTLAAKLFEYVGCGRPVLVCAPPEFEARQLVESTGTGLGAWTDAELTDALRRLETMDVATGRTSLLSRAHAAHALIGVLSEAAGRSQRAE